MSSDREDARTAAGMQASISSFVLTAALAIIAAEAALVVFFFDKRTISLFGDAMLVLGPVLVIASFIAGGKGLNMLSKNGYAGDWRLTAVSGYFNWQAFLTLGSAIALMLSVSGTADKAPDSTGRIDRLDAEVARLAGRLRQVQSTLDANPAHVWRDVNVKRR